MIGVDTNILIRLLVKDDTMQIGQVTTFLSERSERSPIYVSVLVLIELAWVLRSQYGYERIQILDSFEALGDRADVLIEDRECVAEAIELAREGVDIADVLISVRNRRAGCQHTVTFDRAAAKAIPGMTLLP